jgi:hypothetical protein
VLENISTRLRVLALQKPTICGFLLQNYPPFTNSLAQPTMTINSNAENDGNTYVDSSPRDYLNRAAEVDDVRFDPHEFAPHI